MLCQTQAEVLPGRGASVLPSRCSSSARSSRRQAESGLFSMVLVSGGRRHVPGRGSRQSRDSQTDAGPKTRRQCATKVTAATHLDAVELSACVPACRP